MADEEVGNLAVKVSMDSSGFQNGVSGLNKQLAVVQSEFKLASTQLGDFGNSTDQLKLKSDSLSQQIDLQKQKVAALEQAFQTSADKKGLDATATQNLQIKLNNAQTVLTNMETELDKTNNQLDEAAKKQSLFGQAADKLGVNMSNLKTAFGAIGIATGTFLKGAIEEAGEAQSSNKNLEQTLKSTGDAAGMTAGQLDNLANSLQKSTTFSDDEIKSGEAMLLTFTNIGKDVFPQATAALLDMSQKMGSAPKDAAIQLGKALNDPINGISALSRVGVTFTEQQKETIKQMVATGDAAGAQKVILNELNKEFGGQAVAAAQTYDGQMKQNENTWKNIQETIGTALLPVMAQLGNEFTQILKPVAEFIEQNPKFTAALLSIVAILGTIVGGLSVVNTVTSALGTLGISFGGLTTTTSAAGVAAGGTAVSFSALIVPILGVTAVIALVAAGAYEIITNWSSIKDFFIKLWTDIQTSAENTWNDIKAFFTNTWTEIQTDVSNIWNAIGTFFTNLWTGIQTTTETIWNEIKTFFSDVWNGIVEVVNGILQPFIQGILDFYNNMKNGVEEIMEGVKQYFSSVWDLIKNIFMGALLLILDLVTGNFTQLRSDAQNIWNNIKQDFSNIWGAIKIIFDGALSTLEGFLQTAWDHITSNIQIVWNGIKTFFSTLWTDISTAADTAWNAFKTWITGFWDSIVQAGKDIWNGLITWFKGLPQQLHDIAVDMFNKMKAGVDETIHTVYDAIVNGITDAVNWITALPAQALQWGSDFVNGFKNGIMNALSSLEQTVENMANSIRSMLHFSTPDQGPLADYETWMPDFMSGLAAGIEANKYKVTDAIKGLSADMSIGTKIIPQQTQYIQPKNTQGNFKNTTPSIQVTQNITVPVSKPSELARQTKNSFKQLGFNF